MKVIKQPFVFPHFVLALTYSFLILPFANLGFDWIHEGVNIGGALGIKSGAVIHRDILEMKGLFFPFYLALVTGAETSKSIFLMKIANLFLIAVSAHLLYVFIKRANREFAIIVPLIWLVSNPVTSNFVFGNPHGTLMISPNNLTVTLIMVILILESKRHNLDTRLEYRYCLIILFIAGLLPWVRVQNLFFSVAILTYLFFHISARNVQKKTFSFFLIFLFSLSLPFAYLVINHAERDWLIQILQFPFRLSELRDTSTYISFSTLGKTISICFFFLCLFLIAVYTLYCLRKASYSIFLLIFISCPFALYLSSKYSIDSSQRFSATNWTLILSNNAPLSVSRAAIFLPLIVVYMVIRQNHNRFLFSNSANDSRLSLADFRFRIRHEIPMLLASLQGLIYLYPNFGNLWEISPLLFVSFVSLLKSINQFLLRSIQAVMFSLTLGLLMTSSFSALSILSLPKYTYQSSPLSGIVESDKSKVLVYDRAMARLSESTGNLLNQCNLPLFSFPDGRFRSVSKYYVNATYRRLVSMNNLSPNNIVTCSNIKNDFSLSGYLLKAEYGLTSASALSIFSKEET